MRSRVSQAHRKVVRNVALPIVSIVSLLICLVIALAVFLGNRQTEDALERQRELARGMIDVRLSELAKVVEDYAHWDDALINLATQPDSAWAENNVGPTMKDRYGVDATFVIDPDGRTSYAMSNGARSFLPAEDIMSSGFNRILLRRSTAGPDAVTSGLAIADGRPALVAVAPLRPYDNPVDETRDRRSVLAFVDLLDDAQLERLSKIYGLPGLHIESGDTELPASVVIITSDGRIPARLAWTGDDPGGRILSNLLPPLLALLATFAGLILIILRQATILLRNLRQAEERASRDLLTGLFNRSVLLQDLDAVTETKGQVLPHTLLYLDLDGFKAVNDTFGHQVGDKVLREAAGRIASAVPRRATVYRLGGDEFAVLIAGNEDVSVIRSVGTQIIAAVGMPMTIEDKVIGIGTTIGVSRVPQDGVSPVEIIRHADEALYVGKREGKGSVRFYIGISGRDIATRHGSRTKTP